MVTDELLTFGPQADMILLLTIAIADKTESDTHSAFSDEVHLRYFLFFIIDHLVFFAWFKYPGHEPEGNCVQEASVVDFIDHKESSKLFEQICK